jgi:hypothetical protein
MISYREREHTCMEGIHRVSCRRFARKFREFVSIVSGRIPERDRTRISRKGGR